MQDPDPFSPRHLGAALAVAGLAALMLGDAGQPRALATAAFCLVAALAAFAVEGLRRLVRAYRQTSRQTPRHARRAETRPRTVPDRPPAAAEAAPAPDAVSAGRWAMPLSQRDPRVHAALSMPVERFRAAGPPAAEDEPAPRAREPRPDRQAGPDPRARAAQETARRAALADVRNRRLARQG